MTKFDRSEKSLKESSIKLNQSSKDSKEEVSIPLSKNFFLNFFFAFNARTFTYSPA